MPLPFRKNLQVGIVSLTIATLICPSLWAQETDSHYSKEDFDTALESGLFEEAGTMAKARLDQAIRAGKVREMSTVELLGDLAEVQRRSGDFETAIQNYELSIEIVESNRDMLDKALTAPLLGLGKTYLESGRADIALDQFNRALHVRSVNDGPHSIEQAETLEAMADAYRSIGKPNKAADVANRLYLLYERRYSAESIEVVPALLKKGDMLGAVGDWRRQRNAYNDALDIVEEQAGKSSISAVRPLLSLGNSHSSEYFESFVAAVEEEQMPDRRLLNEAETYFAQAIEIVRSAPDIDWRIAQDAYIGAADFYTMTDEQSRARVLYRSAWQLLSGTEEQLLQRKEHLEQVAPLLQLSPDLTVAIPAGVDIEDSSVELITGSIISQFTVSRRGKLRDIGLVEIYPERNDRIEAEVKRALTTFIYRPRFERGVAVDTAGVLVRYEFPYPRALPVNR